MARSLISKSHWLWVLNLLEKKPIESQGFSEKYLKSIKN